MSESLIGAQGMHPGHIVQTVHLFNSTHVTAVVSSPPTDDSVPLITEGFALWSLAITPKSVTNKILILSSVFVGAASSGANHKVVFIHDGTNTFIAKDSHTDYVGDTKSIDIVHLHSPATISPITYFVRLGGNGNCDVNGSQAVSFYGVAGGSSLTLMEIKA